MADVVRSYLEFRDPPEPLVKAYRSGAIKEIGQFLPMGLTSVRVLPPTVWTPRDAKGEEIPVRPTRLAIAIEHEAGATPGLARKLNDGKVTLNADLPIAMCSSWCPSGLVDRFGDQTDARDIMGGAALAAANALGAGVNVLVVDQGLNKDALMPRYGGGWDNGNIQAGKAKLTGHGMMVVRNVMALAPQATFWDAPLIPDEIEDVGTFISSAANLLNFILDQIEQKRANGAADYLRPWVITNSWAVYDRRTDRAPPHDYVNNPSHPFNLAMDRADRIGLDLVFAAGNCGGICPKARCGPDDRGPGQSILGANSHPKVLTVGAVRTDALWIGYSSQGPGQSNLAQEKPDVCAPSNFVEAFDYSVVNSGTSTSAALAAGGIAALRSLARFDTQTWPPDRLRARIRSKAGNGTWDESLGYGVMNAGKVLQ
jgi:hypothetical protein